MNDFIQIITSATIAGVGSFIIYNSVTLLSKKKSEDTLYEKSHLYAILMEDKRARNESVDDLISNFKLRDRWYDLKGLRFEDKVLLILAGYRIEDAINVYREIGRSNLEVQAHLRSGNIN